jgi:hypothetical protein
MNCQFLPPGGGISPGYILKCLLSENCKNANLTTATEARENLSADLESK